MTLELATLRVLVDLPADAATVAAMLAALVRYWPDATIDLTGVRTLAVTIVGPPTDPPPDP